METVTPLRVSHKILNMRVRKICNKSSHFCSKFFFINIHSIIHITFSQFQPVESIFYDEPFVLQTNITSSAPWSVKITDTQYKLKSEVTMDTYLPKVLTSCKFNKT